MRSAEQKSAHLSAVPIPCWMKYPGHDLGHDTQTSQGPSACPKPVTSLMLSRPHAKSLCLRWQNCCWLMLGHPQAHQLAGNNLCYLELQLNPKGHKYLSTSVQGSGASGCAAEGWRFSGAPKEGKGHEDFFQRDPNLSISLWASIIDLAISEFAADHP